MLQPGCEGPFDVQKGRRDFSRDAAAENGLILPGRENLLDFLSCGLSLLSYNGNLRDPFAWPQERQPLCELGGAPRDSSPVGAGS